MKLLRLISQLKSGYLLVSLWLSVGTVFQANAKPTQIPLSVSFAAEPNVMLLLDTSFTMGPKLATTKQALTKAITEIDNIRFCLSIFNNNVNRRGSNIFPTMQCTGDANELEELIDSIQDPTIVFPMPNSARPLASTFYDISRYFRGKGAYFGPWPAYQQPAIEYRCQDNNVIIISDGEPESDWPAPVPNSTIDLLTDPITAPISLPLEDFPKSLPELTQSASQIDLVPTNANTHAVGRALDFAKQSFDSPRFENQTLETHTVSLLGNFNTLNEAAVQGGGTALSPLLRSEVYTRIEQIISSASLNPGVAQANISQTAVVSDGNQSNIFITAFDTSDWSGSLINIESDSDDSDFSPEQVWNASDLLIARDSRSRNIFTHRPDTGQAVPFQFDQLNSNQSASLDEATVNFIRGDRSNEIGNGGSDAFRSRNSVLGDIVNSPATYVKKFNFGYPDSDYLVYLTGDDSNATNVSERTAVVYAGGNDGMLHAFNAESGQEIFAFIPNTVIDELSVLASPNYPKNHQYFVDGKMTVVDARLDDNWSTVLASPLGAGFKGLFLLNITDPETSAYNEIFTWEKSEQSEDYSSMGFILNSPKIGRVMIPETDGGFREKWLLFVGNGVHSEDQNDIYEGAPIIGKASVYIIDLENGNVIKEIVLDNGRNQDNQAKYTNLSEGNGVTSVTAVDQNTNTYIDRLYAADLKGNLWRINYEFITDDEIPDGSQTQDYDYIRNHFELAFVKNGEPEPIFKAVGPVRQSPSDSNPSGQAQQPITSEITVTGPPIASNESVGELLFFGTGQYFDTHHIQSNNNLNVQSMYAIWDKGGWDQRTDAIDKQDDLNEQTVTQLAGNQERTFDEVISYDNNTLGWYIDLPDYGERIIAQPVSLFDNISFDSLSPLNGQSDIEFDPCIEGATAWSMIARQDTATALLSLANSSIEEPSPIGGVKRSENFTKGSIYIEQPNGQLISPTIDASDLDNILVGSETQIQKQYRRGAWKRIQF